MLVALGGAWAIDAVLLASAVVPPVIVIVLVRLLWVWANSDEENRHPGMRELVREALWMKARKP